MSIKPLLMIGCFAASLVAANPAFAGIVSDPYLNVQQVSPNLSLELKARYSNDRIFVAELFDNGAENQIDLHLLDPGLTGVTVLDTQAGVATGPLFGMGDWCAGSNFTSMPFIDGNGFDVKTLRWNYATSTVTVMPIPDSVPGQYTSSDCSVLNDGNFVISALNFDTGAVDFFQSTDQGQNWSLTVSYAPSGGGILGGFNGGYIPQTGPVGIDIGVLYQNDSGMVEAAMLDPDTGDVAGVVEIQNHVDDVVNGFLKECDGMVAWGFAVGLCGSGTDAWLGSIDTTNGQLWTTRLNDVLPGEHLPFQGVSGSVFSANGIWQYHALTNRHAVVFGSAGGWSPPVLLENYPFEDNGGPVESVSGGDRLYILAPGEFGAGGKIANAKGTAAVVGLGIATLDPALITPPQQVAEGTPIPFLSLWSVTCIALLLLAAGVLATRRRPLQS